MAGLVRVAPVSSRSRPSHRSHRFGDVGSDTGGMGFNPNRKRVARRTDIVFVAAAVIAVVALVIWTAFG